MPHALTHLPLVAIRDVAVAALSLSILQQTIEDSPSSGCLYDSIVGQLLIWCVMLSSVLGMTVHVREWTSWAQIGVLTDIVAIPAGILLMSGSAPSTHYGGVAVDPHCTFFGGPVAHATHQLGQTLAYGTAVRVGLLQYNVADRRWLTVGIVVVGSFALTFSLGLAPSILSALGYDPDRR